MSTLILRCSCLLLINLNSSWQYLHIPVLTYLFILLVNNFVVNEGNSATEAFSSSPSAFAKHTHTTIWLNTISSYFEMPFPSQSSLQYKQINIYLVRKRRHINPRSAFWDSRILSSSLHAWKTGKNHKEQDVPVLRGHWTSSNLLFVRRFTFSGAPNGKFWEKDLKTTTKRE